MFQIITLAILALAPSSVPTTRQDVESDLRRIIAGLQSQIVELKQTNNLLRREVADLRSKEAQHKKPPPDSLPADEFPVRVGMNREAVIEVLKEANSYGKDSEERLVGGKPVKYEVWRAPSLRDDPAAIYFINGIVDRVVRRPGASIRP